MGTGQAPLFILLLLLFFYKYTFGNGRDLQPTDKHIFNKILIKDHYWVLGCKSNNFHPEILV